MHKILGYYIFHVFKTTLNLFIIKIVKLHYIQIGYDILSPESSQFFIKMIKKLLGCILHKCLIEFMGLKGLDRNMKDLKDQSHFKGFSSLIFKGISRLVIFKVFFQDNSHIKGFPRQFTFSIFKGYSKTHTIFKDSSHLNGNFQYV